jgi:adenylate cyclase class 2
VLTYKGPARSGEAVSVRQEIEIEVSDFAAARRLLEALEFHVEVIYEKYRTTYTLDSAEIVLDELPYGSFVEIEGPDVERIRDIADRLSLEWEARSAASYLAMFSTLVEARGIPARNLTFAELSGVAVTPSDLGLRYAG